MLVGGQKITLTSERELAINTSGKLKAQNFDTRPDEDDFFRWSALRSGYLSEASADEAHVYIGVGPGWYGPNWYGPDGTGIRISSRIRFFPLTGSFIVRSVGASTRRLSSIGRLSSTMVSMDTVLTASMSFTIRLGMVSSPEGDFTAVAFTARRRHEEAVVKNCS